MQATGFPFPQLQHTGCAARIRPVPGRGGVFAEAEGGGGQGTKSGAATGGEPT